MKALVLVTALPPTIGHANLIRWASNYMKVFGGHLGEVNVLVCTQPGEPMCTERFLAIGDFARKLNNVNVHLLHAKMPQYPKDEDPEFWNKWTREITRKVGKVDVVISSETYGAKLARSLSAKNVIADVNREMVQISATRVRKYPTIYYDALLPEFQYRVKKVITIFGADSCGKTTAARELSTNGFVNEYARPYLESLDDKSVTDDKMMDIVKGQYIHQMTGKKSIDSPFVIQDTDLLSTIGYYRLFNPNGYQDIEGYKLAVKLFKQSKSDLYVLMPDDIPFVPDPLRYGIDKRESNDAFWLDLLKEYDCNYIYVKDAPSPESWVRRSYIQRHVYALYTKQSVFTYKREREDGTEV